MIQEDEILFTLDNYNNGSYTGFILLGDDYSYLLDSRLNIFRNNEKWAIAVERLGYSSREGRISLKIIYFGNCLYDFEEYNGEKLNEYSIYLVDDDSFENASDGENVKYDAEFILVRDKPLQISHNKLDYQKAGIVLGDFKSGQITWAEAGRLLVSQYSETFRALDSELYKSIPSDLKKIMVIDEWFHKDYALLPIQSSLTDDEIRNIYNLPGFNKAVDFDSMLHAWRQQEIYNDEWNKRQWNENRPSTYETWQLIAKVISTGNPSYYKPTLKPNSHWSNWLESGTM